MMETGHTLRLGCTWFQFSEAIKSACIFSMKTTRNTRTMNSIDLRNLRLQMGFSLKELSIVTKIPYRTLQDYEYGQRGIPNRVARLLREEAAKEKRIKAALYKGIEQRVEQEFPNGFASEVNE